MLQFIKMGGPYMTANVIVTLVIIIQIIRKFIDLFIKKELGDYQLELGINSIIVLGGLSAILGILGQFNGIYTALNIIIHAPEINPHIIAEGFTISFTTTLYGLNVLVISLIIWFIFRSRYKYLIRPK
jgi:biopolymer transport protein ExbB/TolQ